MLPQVQDFSQKARCWTPEFLAPDALKVPAGAEFSSIIRTSPSFSIYELLNEPSLFLSILTSVLFSAALMNNATGKFTVYNLSRYRDSSYLPASTFKIVNSLIGLQTGKIVNDSMVIKWDGVKRSVDEWNKDLSMYQAFRVSAVPYYQEVARRIGKDTMQLWLDSLKYGAKEPTEKVTIKSAVDTFWLDNSLKVTPDQQVGLIKRLYFDQLPFFKVYQEVVKRAMLFEDNANYRLGYKTGWGTTEKGHALGWVVGWIEENKHPYFFVLNVESPDKNYDMKAVLALAVSCCGGGQPRALDGRDSQWRCVCAELSRESCAPVAHGLPRVESGGLVHEPLSHLDPAV